MTRQDYITKFAKAVIDSVRGIALFPSVLMAQAILESSNQYGQPGENRLAKFYNNHFGIKADPSWKGKKVNMKTGEVYSGQAVTIMALFRVYDHAADSFRDRNKFLIENHNYQRAGVFTAKTPEEQAERLQAAGYATDPHYANKIKALINMLHLKNLDIEATKKDTSGEA